MNYVRNEVLRCKRFLKNNGWHYDAKTRGGSGAFIKDGAVAVEFGDCVIHLLDGGGDFAEIIQDPSCYYTLVGMLLELRQLTAGYKSEPIPNPR